MIEVNNSECKFEGNPPQILSELTVAMACFFHTIGEERETTIMLLHCIDTARICYREGEYIKTDKDIINKLTETEGD